MPEPARMTWWNDIREKDFDKSKYPPEILNLAEGAFKAYQKWAKHTK